MRILHVITSLLTGGAEKLMVDLLPRMKAKGYDVELCTFDSTVTPFRLELEKAGVVVHAFHYGVQNVYDPRNILRLRKLIISGKYDIIHTHNTAPQLYASIANIGIHVRLVTTEHNTTNRRRNNIFFKGFDAWMYRQYSKIICISKQAEINLRSYLHKLNNVCIVFNGIDYYKYSKAELANDVRTIGSRIVVMVAAFRDQKDQPTLIKAMQYLPKDFHLCLVGDGARRTEYENLISELKLNERVHLLGIRNDVHNVLAASDYVVMCSHYEGLSLSSLEGMASGKPFLADDVDGLREIVKGHGVLFEHGDFRGFADAILKLEEDPEYRKNIVESCQKKASEYDIDNVVDNYIDIYKNVLYAKQ